MRNLCAVVLAFFAAVAFSAARAAVQNFQPCPGTNNYGIGTIGSSGVTQVLLSDPGRRYFAIVGLQTGHTDYWGYDGLVSSTGGMPLYAGGGGYEWFPNPDSPVSGQDPVTIAGTSGDYYYCVYSDGPFTQ